MFSCLAQTQNKLFDDEIKYFLKSHPNKKLMNEEKLDTIDLKNIKQSHCGTNRFIENP